MNHKEQHNQTREFIRLLEYKWAQKVFVLFDKKSSEAIFVVNFLFIKKIEIGSYRVDSDK